MYSYCFINYIGVYTRNRNFRLYKSSKIGKYVALEVAEDNRFFPMQSKNISKENQYFLSSLVSNVRYAGPELNCCVLMNIYYSVNSFVSY